MPSEQPATETDPLPRLITFLRWSVTWGVAGALLLLWVPVLAHGLIRESGATPMVAEIAAALAFFLQVLVLWLYLPTPDYGGGSND